jgi:RNA polymerase sigma-70 factor (ECF subfamily)
MDEAKFDAFYRATANSVWAYLFRMTADPAAADDLLQKTFLNFLRANPAFASDEHMRRYLFRTATNQAMDHFREKKKSAGNPVAEQAVQQGPGSDLRHDMMRVFSELKPRERAMLWLAHVEESDHEEIGEAVGVKATSVRVLLFRARKKLADLLKRRGIGPEVLR